jgi:hypothetical protein
VFSNAIRQHERDRVDRQDDADLRVGFFLPQRYARCYEDLVEDLVELFQCHSGNPPPATG